MNLPEFAPKGRQMAALIKKNLIITVLRRPLGFLLSMYGLPLAILAVLLSIPSFFAPSAGYGIGEPAAIRTLADVLDQSLVIVKPPGIGSDVDAVIDRIVKPLDSGKIIQTDDEEKVADICSANSRGISSCFAAIIFHDSPETTSTVNNTSVDVDHHTWQYTFRTDPAKNSLSGFDAKAHITPDEKTYMPLVLAVNNAIADRDDRPNVFGYTTTDPELLTQYTLEDNIRFMSQFYLFAIFMASFIIIIYRCTSKLTRDRDSGMSQLVDSMSGRGAIASRLLTWLFVFDIITLPCYIVGGILYWYIRFPTSSVGILIGWQILLGLAVNSSTVFAASFFSKARVSAIYVCGGFTLLVIGTQVFSTQQEPPPFESAAIALTLLFPSANFVLFIQNMFAWEIADLPARLNGIPQDALGLHPTKYKVTQATMLGFLVAQILVYPILAILVEWYMHGISFSSRSFHQDRKTSSSSRVVQTTDLKKRFTPNIFAKIFCCGTRRSVNAVDGVSIEGYQGQVLCLVGPNGSGKTTTLHMMAGFLRPTAGDVAFNAAPSQIGICPQRNTLWDELTVKEHVALWSQIKGGNESESDIAELIAACDLTKKSNSQARTLSGGQKRKLQLACMFVGDSSVCLIDECTSGLDPLSRRVIWEILLQQRSKRSIIFTTHFLDEVDVLADHIVILSKGKVKCHGAVTELKNNYGNGYEVLAPHSSKSVDVGYEGVRHQDRTVYRVPDSQSAMKLSAQFSAAGITDVTMAGPQVEDVFLNVADDVELLNEAQSGNNRDTAKMEHGKLTSFGSQLGTIYRKRWTVFWRLWWPYFFTLAVPIIVVPFMRIMLENFTPEACIRARPNPITYSPLQFERSSYCDDRNYYGCDSVTIGPNSVNKTLYSLAEDGVFTLSKLNLTSFNSFTRVFETEDEWKASYSPQPDMYDVVPGFFLSSDSSPDIVSYQIDGSSRHGFDWLNLMTQAKSGVETIVNRGEISEIEPVSSGFSPALLPRLYTNSACVAKRKYRRHLCHPFLIDSGPLPHSVCPLPSYGEVTKSSSH